MPILNFGFEIWGFHNGNDYERIYTKYLKNTLGIRPQTTNACDYGDFGKVPFDNVRKERILRYWFKIVNSHGSLIN